MKYNVRHIKVLCEWILLLFVLSSLSPVSALIIWDKSNGIEQSSPGKTELRLGVSWLRNILSLFTPADPDDTDGDGRPDGYQILIGGGLHAVSAKTIRIIPSIQSHVLPRDTVRLLPTFDYQHNIPVEDAPRERQGYPSHTDGLSPPQLLS